ncbi:endopeptidase La [Peptoniphilaceae bacterium SGI.131]
MEKNYYKKRNIEVPLLVLRGIWIFPNMVINFDAGRDKSKKALEKSLIKDSLILLATQIDPKEEEIDKANINKMGVLAKIKQTIKLPNGNIRVLVEGVSRAQIQSFIEEEEYFLVDAIEYEIKDFSDSVELKAIRRLCYEDMKKYIDLKSDMPRELLLNLSEIKEAHRFADMATSYMALELSEYQDIIDTLDVYERLIKLHEIISAEIEILSLEEEINQRVRNNINKNQKEYYLKEQLQIIKSELGESADPEDYIDDYISRIEALPISKESMDHLLKEANRLSFISPGSPEINVVRTYLDYVLDLPWANFTDDLIDIDKSRKVLDSHHYGLKDVKERVLEFISVRKLKNDMKGSILCLVGPPGVGKTSIVKSVAESMNRQYVSMRLGGLGDESEIRGHRKTYIGAMPGRIVTSLIEAKSMNPVFLLDEIDKVSSDYRADPASALLEVLDPNQNNKFMDRYLEIPLDLSQVMFVTTANTTSTIPRALLDRMEVIEISGYTPEEKFNIAKKHLLSKQMEEHGIAHNMLKVTDSVIEKIINNYTRESGVRNLERHIAKICRKAAMRLVRDGKSVSVNLKNFRDFLGRELVLDDDIVKKPEVGVVTGLAWTQVGGELLQIEVNVMEGKGKVQLTGSLGDVMKESAMAAISYIRANAESLGVDKDFHNKFDIHVHVPEGATPKDGPSAGITITTGLVSALSGKKVRQDIAMTGEVTIRGRVLAIGGLKEKALAANRYGINTVLIPKQNEKDLEEIPESIRKLMKFVRVTQVKEVLDLAIIK